MKLPDATRMGPVELAVRDLDPSVRFYRDLLGMQVHAHAARHAELGSDEVLLKLTAAPDAAPRPPGAAGLYHVAYLVPTRADLGRAIAHLVRARWPLQGASDHEFSEALYLADPEGNGIEIYADRPRSLWPALDGRTMRGGPMPMDVEAVLAEGGDVAWSGYPAGTRVGHVHLNVSDVAPAAEFYRGALGFDMKMQMPGSAAFLSAGGYHHHVAVNSWGTRGGPANSGETLGLRALSVVLPDGESHENAVKRLGSDAPADPSGNVVRLSRA
ncbi:MAG TPA: VOC family protein [Candidatus Thermoplasmatota archaeon]|nr:VOC family protein [Candidatus Thermoplasmatota archaeon]